MVSPVKLGFLLFAILVAHSNGQGGIMQLLMLPLNQIASTKGITVAQIADQPFTKTLNVTTGNLQELTSMMMKVRMSPALLNALNTMKLKDFLNYYKGFQSISSKNYTFTPMAFLSYAFTFDSTNTTCNTLKSLSFATGGNGTVAPLLRTTTASLCARNYLFDAYPLLMKNLPMILNKTRNSFFIKSTRLPEKYYRALVGSHKLVDDILKYRMAYARLALQGDATKMAGALTNFTMALSKATQKVLAFTTRLPALQMMRLSQAPAQCGIPLGTLKMKTLMQITLLCLKLPEDFPLISFMPKGTLLTPFQTSLNKIATKVGMPIDVLLNNNMQQVMILFMKSVVPKIPVNGTLGLPAFYAAHLKGYNITRLQDVTILELARNLSGIPYSQLAVRYNVTQSSAEQLAKTTFKSLPDYVNSVVGVKYSLQHFYYVTLDSIIKGFVSTDRTSRNLLFRNFTVLADGMTVPPLAATFKLSIEDFLRMPVLGILVKMSGVSKDAFLKYADISQSDADSLGRASLRDVVTVKSFIDRSAQLRLTPRMFHPPVYRHLRPFFMPMKSLIGPKIPGSFDLQALLRRRPSIRMPLHTILKHMGIKLLADMKFMAVRKAMNLSEPAFGAKNFYDLLKWMKNATSKGKPAPRFADFPNYPLMKTLKECRIKYRDIAQGTMLGFIKKCYRFPLGEEVEKRLYYFPKAILPLLISIKMKDFQTFLGMNTGQFLKTAPKNLFASMNATKMMRLFMPMQKMLQASGLSVNDALKMPLNEILNKSMPYRQSVLTYFKQHGIRGAGLDFTRQRTLEDALRALGMVKSELAKITMYDVMQNISNLFTKDGNKCRKLSSITNLCIAQARCVNLVNSYRCRCKDGLAGDGKTCSDQCSITKCPAGSECSNVPDSGAICRCSKRGYVMKRGKCKRVKGHIIQVTKMKFKQKYKKAYADKNSKEFKTKAAEIEDVLFRSVCKRIGCSAIVVTAIKSGSIVVDFNAVFDSDNVTTAQLQDATVQAMNSTEMAALSPETSTKPQARSNIHFLSSAEVDACQSADCGMNSVCKSMADGSYACECKEGFKRHDDDCKKHKGGLKLGAIIGIIVAVLVILVIVIIVVVVVRSRKKGKKDAKYGMVYDKPGEAGDDKVQLTGGNLAYGYAETKPEKA
eukprot:gene458-1100_t